MEEASTDEEREDLRRQLDVIREGIARIESSTSRRSTEASGSIVGSDNSFADEAHDDDSMDDFLDTLLSPPPPKTARQQEKPAPGATAKQAMWALVGLIVTLNLTYVLSLLIIDRPEDGYITFWEGWVFHLATFSPALLAAFRAVVDQRGRWAWWLVTVGIALFAAGNLLFTYRDQNLDPVPFPGWSDILYLESTLALAVAFGLVTHIHVGGVSRASRLNGLVVGLAAASVAVALWFNTILEQSGSAAAVLVGLAYPLFDLVLIVIALSGLSLVRFRPSPAVSAFVAGAVIWAIGDIVFLRQIAEDTYLPGTILEATWALGILFFGLACWMPQPPARPADETPPSVSTAFMPWIAALAALGVIGWSVDHNVPSLGVWLAMASVVTVLVRIGLSVTELRQANEAFSQAWIGEVAGFRERPITQPISVTRASDPSPTPTFWVAAFGAIATAALVGVGFLSWQVATGQSDQISATEGTTDASDTTASLVTTTATAGADPASAAITAAPGTDTQVQALQRDLDWLLGFTPLVFDTAQVELSDQNQRVLNNVIARLLASPGIPITIVGYTDDSGSEETNLELSTARATQVRDYLVAQGVPTEDLTIQGRGKAIASGTADQSGLERRVEFEVASAGPPPALGPLRVGLVSSSASNDLAFTQSMVDSLNGLIQERNELTISVFDNIIVPEDAANSIREMADQGYGLIVVHDLRLGSVLLEVAAEYPGVAFAWGPTTQAPGLPNVYTYTVAAEQGGYVLGALAAELSESKVLGVVGPIEVGDAQRYVAGYEAGATTEHPDVTVLVEYTGSFLDASLASEATANQIAANADIITGVGPVTASAASVATTSGVRWMGNQVDQSAVNPTLVVASQVYHWEVPLKEIIADIDAGTTQGRAVIATLENKGITIQLNPDYPLDPSLAQRLTELTAEIVDGTITPPVR